jgi:DGQHR domain-containing protein
MIAVPAMRISQFGLDFYQVSLSAADVEKLVRFETLGYSNGSAVPKRRKGRSQSVNWELLEKRIASSEQAYQRPIIARKIAELVEYYSICREHQNMPAVPGAVIIASDYPLEFEPARGGAVGLLQIPEAEGCLRAIDGQHRLLALQQFTQANGPVDFQVPAIVFDRLGPEQVVEMFVTINAKHTRLKSSHLVSLEGRKLYRDEALALAHDVVRFLNQRADSPLCGEIRMLGVGPGRVSQSPLAEEIKAIVKNVETFGGGRFCLWQVVLAPFGTLIWPHLSD